MFLKYLILGIIQGITEPLPVSSSGHLVLIKSLINVNTDGMLLELMLHLGSLIAICVYYWDDIVKLVVETCTFLFTKKKTKQNQKSFFYVLKLIIATIPAGIVGLLFKDKIEVFMNKPMYVGFALLLTAVLIFFAFRKQGHKNDDEITYLDALVIGLFQCVALLPGVSRSGSTICGAIFRDVKRESAMKFSFMLFLPIGILAVLSGLKDLGSADLSVVGLPMLAAMIASGVITYVVLRFVKSLLDNNKYRYFSYYCAVVGLLAIIFLH